MKMRTNKRWQKLLNRMLNLFIKFSPPGKVKVKQQNNLNNRPYKEKAAAIARASGRNTTKTNYSIDDDAHNIFVYI